MRLKSALWVQALLRQNAIAGRFGAVLRRGASEAGTIYVVVNHLDGTNHLFGPPPGSAIDEHGDRQWIAELAPPASSEAVGTFIAKRVKFDPDIWVVEVEDRAGTAGLTTQAM